MSHFQQPQGLYLIPSSQPKSSKRVLLLQIEDMDGEDGGGIVTRTKAEIDTRPPFQSVKEAVMLFGERVLAGELYANKLREMQRQNGHGFNAKIGSMNMELEETKQSLKSATEEGKQMANTLSSLKEELERTKLELRKLKERESESESCSEKRRTTEDSSSPRSVTIFDIEDVKFEAHDSTMFEMRMENNTNKEEKKEDEEEGLLLLEFQKKRYVTFANPPLAHVVVPQQQAQQGGSEPLERSASLRRRKKKQLISLITSIFSKRK